MFISPYSPRDQGNWLAWFIAVNKIVTSPWWSDVPIGGMVSHNLTDPGDIVNTRSIVAADVSVT